MTAHTRHGAARGAATGLAIVLTALLLPACGDRAVPADDVDASSTMPAGSVESSGKSGTTLDDVPAEVLETARRARPELTILEAEYETRDGREYYDLGGVLPDDREIELDMTRVDGTWTVVEIQRDIGYPEVPVAVADALKLAVPDWEAARIIESDQGDGTIIYEFFGAGEDPVKHEVKWSGGFAEFLTEEWAH